MGKMSKRNRARDVIAEKAARNAEESATRQRRRIIIATRCEHVEIIFPPLAPLASRVIKLCGSPARSISLRVFPSPSLLFLFVVNSFLALNSNPFFFPFNSASTYLPCSIRHGPPSGRERRGGGKRKEEKVVAKPR